MRNRNKCDFLLVFLLLSSATICFGALCRDHEKGDGFQNPANGVCSNVDIRITMDQFRRLQNCTVIEGFLHISLIERAIHEDYEMWSFPELREITGYIRLYRVYGLKTLRTLFPNLTVIGGRQLFNNYALVAYEMPDLEELGLVSLRTISRGGVRITKSKKLCYVDTVDWGRLGVDAGAQDFKDNKEENQCANYCPENCPTTKVGNVEAKRCWTSQHCQLGLNCRCKVNQTCMDNGTCCHSYCVGGCVGTGPADCYSCKGVTYKGKCQPKCPPFTYMFSDRRCLTEKECLALVNSTKDVEKNTKILKGEKGEPSICVTKCPQNYTIQEEREGKNLECVKCQGFCPKVCNSTEVNSIEDAQKLKDCSKIVGPLIIHIMTGTNVAQEMEKNLGNIKEVTGYISIRQSYALLTLYFLKSLEIFGDSPLHQEKSLIVMDNSNLQELFPEEQMKKMKFRHGKVSFHGNRKLCLYKINNFVKYLNLSEPPSEQDISRATNGDLTSCIELHLNLKVTEIYHNTVWLNWTKVTSDTRYLRSYVISYKEIKDKSENINIYQGRDACSTDAWMTIEQPPTDDSKTFQLFHLKDLKAYTTYAVYIQTYSLPTATHAAITNVETFTTNPYYPSEPLDLEVSSENPHELIVKWKPPKFPNGNVTHYKVIYQKQLLDVRSFEKRNYCREPANPAPKEVSKEKEEEAEKKQNVTASCCACPKTKEELEAEARKQEIEIYFENYLHDQVYCQRYDILPADISLTELKLGSEWPDIINMERTVGSKNVTTSRASDVMISETHNVSSDKNTTEVNVSYNLTLAVHEVYNATKAILQNLEHFQEYNIEVQACQEAESNDRPGTKLCSNRAMTAGRTKPLRIMDSINESSIDVQIVVNITTDVFITWKPPPNPNSLILTYNIFYKRANQNNLVPQQICVNSKDFQKHSGYHLTGLDRGNWTFQINAVSLAGNGSLTQEKFFILRFPSDDEDTNSVILIAAVIVVVTVVIVVLIMFLLTKFRFRNSLMTVISPNINYVPSDQMYTMDDWEVDRDKIKLIRELGQGSFGMVYEGVAKGMGDDPEEETRVAVKTVNDRASFNDRREFLKEATTMKAFDCYHVVKLLGVVSTGQPALVIMELMALGDLKNYLREHRPDESERPGVGPPKLLDTLQMAGEIADGMAYLADKKFVHRDLAARNCMVAEDKVVKIGDFGMTRDIYETDYYRKGGKGMLPVRWMAPESLKDGVFTSMSDVWSYGVVMWEMVTLAAQPYQGLSNEEVVKYISEDSTMDIPAHCPEDMAYLMHRCWAKKPKNRPSFKEIIEYLLPQLSSRFQKVSYFFNDGGGPVNGEANRAGELGHLIEDDAGSNYSLNREGAAAQKVFLNQGHGNYSFDGSPHPSGGSFSLYDDGIEPERCTSQNENARDFSPDRRDLNVDKDFGDINSSNSRSEYTASISDSQRPFILDGCQTVPSITTWEHSVLSPEHNGNDSMLNNSGHVELQPLITKDCSPSPPSARINSAQSPNLDLSEYITNQSQTVTAKDLKTCDDPKKLQQHDAINHVNPVRPDSSNGRNPLQIKQSSAKPVPPPVLMLPALKLPTLNQPPSGGFRRPPLYKSIHSSRNSQSSSNNQDSCHLPLMVTNASMVNIKDDTRPAPAAQHNSSPSGAVITNSSPSGEVITNSSPSGEVITNTSDDSKHSSRYLFMNGQTNGHLPVSTLRHRTAPC